MDKTGKKDSGKGNVGCKTWQTKVAIKCLIVVSYVKVAFLFYYMQVSR